MYRRLYITIQWPHVLTEYCILYINYLVYRLLYRYTAIQRDTSDLMYRHPSEINGKGYNKAVIKRRVPTTVPYGLRNTSTLLGTEPP